MSKILIPTDFSNNSLNQLDNFIQTMKEKVLNVY